MAERIGGGGSCVCVVYTFLISVLVAVVAAVAAVVAAVV